MRHDYVTSMSGVRHWFDWLPAPVASILLLAIAAAVALLFSRLITDAIPRLPGLKRLPIIPTLIVRLRSAIRMLLMLLAAGAALPAAAVGLSSETLYMLGKVFAFLFILILGFGVIRALRIATDSYLTRIARRDPGDDITVRSHQTQIRVLRRLVEITLGVITVASALMVFDTVQRFGLSLFASAGAASLVVGLSARPALSNLIAGIQIAITQPIRMEDMLILNGDWAWVEEINATYVVLRTWDKRRYIVPIAYFLENPFQNWTHSSPALIGSIFLWLDYRTPMDRIRQFLEEEIVHCPDWDKDRANLACQVADSNAQVISIRIVAGAAGAGQMWNLCCDMRERILRRLREELPECIPRGRTALVGDGAGDDAWPEALVAPRIARPDQGPYTGPNLQAAPARA
ncbi:mechanosensitive ion channel family protein [Gluconacetobacter tumulisoli]|uniref:Mechanosensitive ion channel family protein n=1 Tax=Gluconacetobacter tumulisoli TaxID=1286189 RepID=A0A7W4PNA0_9PROT|nr:mechanosensitive ion channel family protein [Gluconacetobacter tumulisoli]MBB2200666.1 mechanosensitive ion channel family protein [Gluconacetobacter tumulisoli]